MWNSTNYNTIDEWRTATGLDTNSQFFFGSNDRVQNARAALEALKGEPTLRPEMFHKLYDLIKNGN
jgi:hypothetical protein